VGNRALSGVSDEYLGDCIPLPQSRDVAADITPKCRKDSQTHAVFAFLLCIIHASEVRSASSSESGEHHLSSVSHHGPPEKLLAHPTDILAPCRCPSRHSGLGMPCEALNLALEGFPPSAPCSATGAQPSR
jgi:hypothetical protein